ncbi:unnamed protein product [Leptosia nina]|uniref:Uncharacterized protein n=1 Tax=Leptosia nina TaxID=320188 RepID=A0AAV1K1X8_9NEOP
MVNGISSEILNSWLLACHHFPYIHALGLAIDAGILSFVLPIASSEIVHILAVDDKCIPITVVEAVLVVGATATEHRSLPIEERLRVSGGGGGVRTALPPPGAVVYPLECASFIEKITVSLV